MRRVAQIMGMPISVDIPDCEDQNYFNLVFLEFERIDENFSNYKPDSQVSMYIRGELNNNLSPELREILKDCERAKRYTNGYFSAMAAGRFDANGYIKGWAIAKAAKKLEQSGQNTFCISAGGDILAKGDKTWRIGIQDPADSMNIRQVVELRDQAVATSGNYERGRHLINPKTKQPADYWSSVSIIGPDIIMADVLATACFVMGNLATKYIAGHPDYKMIAYKS